MPRSLKLPVGFAPSNLKYSSTPSFSDSRPRADQRRAALPERESAACRARPAGGRHSGRSRPSELRHATIGDDGKRERRRRTSSSAVIAASASASEPSRASWVTTCTAAPSPFWCCSRRAIEISRSASCDGRRARARPGGRRPKGGSTTASGARPAAGAATRATPRRSGGSPSPSSRSRSPCRRSRPTPSRSRPHPAPRA